jgi:hypothetical protein
MRVRDGECSRGYRAAIEPLSVLWRVRFVCIVASKICELKTLSVGKTYDFFDRCYNPDYTRDYNPTSDSPRSQKHRASFGSVGMIRGGSRVTSETFSTANPSSSGNKVSRRVTTFLLHHPLTNPHNSESTSNTACSRAFLCSFSCLFFSSPKSSLHTRTSAGSFPAPGTFPVKIS